jgi:hypothetical protein
MQTLEITNKLNQDKPIKNAKPNSDGLIKCLQPTQDRFVTSPKIYARKSVPFIKYFDIRTVSSPGTASLG